MSSSRKSFCTFLPVFTVCGLPSRPNPVLVVDFSLLFFTSLSENRNLLLHLSLTWCLKDPPPLHLFNQSGRSAHHTWMTPVPSSSSSPPPLPLQPHSPLHNSQERILEPSWPTAGPGLQTGPLHQETGPSQTGPGTRTNRNAPGLN